MAGCRYGICLLVFNLVSHARLLSSLVRYQVEHSKRNSISTRTQVLLSESKTISFPGIFKVLNILKIL